MLIKHAPSGILQFGDVRFFVVCACVGGKVNYTLHIIQRKKRACEKISFIKRSL